MTQRDHELTTDCWCKPRVEVVKPNEPWLVREFNDDDLQWLTRHSSDPRERQLAHWGLRMRKEVLRLQRMADAGAELVSVMRADFDKAMSSTRGFERAADRIDKAIDETEEASLET